MSYLLCKYRRFRFVTPLPLKSYDFRGPRKADYAFWGEGKIKHSANVLLLSKTKHRLLCFDVASGNPRQAVAQFVRSEKFLLSPKKRGGLKLKSF